MAKRRRTTDEKNGTFGRALGSLFPALSSVTTYDQQAVQLPSQGGFGTHRPDPTDNEGGLSPEEEYRFAMLPQDRRAKYPIFATMSSDPTVWSGLTAHIAFAFSAKLDDRTIVSIDSKGDSKDAIVEDLKETIQPIINSMCRHWGLNAAIYGDLFPRVYLDGRNGVTHIATNFYSLPSHVNVYEKGGQKIGYTHAYQQHFHDGQRLIMDPWSLLHVRLPRWQIHCVEPVRYDQTPFDIGNDDMTQEGIVESQAYGESIIERAFEPWYDLKEAIVSLNMSRRNAAVIDQIVGVSLGDRLMPEQAGRYIADIASKLKRVGRVNARQSLRRDSSQLHHKHIIPVLGDKGRLDISTIEGAPNIEAIEDIMLHVKRMAGAMGSDPSLLGFADMLSGGLGDGGFYRTNITAASRSEILQAAIYEAGETLCNIHVAAKYGKYFPKKNRPWEINFASVSSALEREQLDNANDRVNLATGLDTLLASFDPNRQKVDPKEYLNWLYTDIIKILPEDRFEKVFPAEKLNTPPSADEGGGGGGEEEGGEFFESAGSYGGRRSDTDKMAEAIEHLSKHVPRR